MWQKKKKSRQYQVNIKSSHLWLLLIFQQLLSNEIYTLPPSFVELRLKRQSYTVLAKTTPSPLLSVRTSCITGCKRTARVHMKLSGFECTGLAHLDYHVWGAMLEKHHELQQKSKTTDELIVVLPIIWEELPQEHINTHCWNVVHKLWGATFYIHPVYHRHHYQSHLNIRKPHTSFLTAFLWHHHEGCIWWGFGGLTPPPRER